MKRNDDWFSPLATWVVRIVCNVLIFVVATVIVGLLICFFVQMGG